MKTTKQNCCFFLKTNLNEKAHPSEVNMLMDIDEIRKQVATKLEGMPEEVPEDEHNETVRYFRNELHQIDPRDLRELRAWYEVLNAGDDRENPALKLKLRPLQSIIHLWLFGRHEPGQEDDEAPRIRP